jgi:CO/xanthine dehydrogenase Mo-binding subunit
MRHGRLLVGYGMASAYYGYVQVPCQARASLGRDGVAVVRSAATDIGPGTYTVMTQVAADTLGLPLDRVRFELGDSTMPPAPLQGGSGLTAALGSAVHDACRQLLRAFAELAASSPASPPARPTRPPAGRPLTAGRAAGAAGLPRPPRGGRRCPAAGRNRRSPGAAPSGRSAAAAPRSSWRRR